MSDIIFIEGLKVPASIGIFEWERQVKQDLIIDCQLRFSLATAGTSNDINDTVSYAEVANQFVQLIEEQHHDLLEHLAERMVSLVFRLFPIEQIELKLAKPSAVPNAASVGIIIKRERSE